MKTFFLAGLLALACCGTVLGQTPTPAPTPPRADETDVVKITTTLIQVDVTVTDKNGKIITDLKPDEIEVYENGEKQKITNFSFISNLRTPAAPEAKKPNELVTLTPRYAVRPENVRRTIALVVDDLTLSFESTYYVRRALKKFVDEQMQEGDLVAIIRTGAGIGALQQFTTDKRQLYAAVERVRWNSVGAGGIGAFAPMQAIPDTEDDGEADPGERTTQGLEREFAQFRESLFATGTLGAINYVVRGMQDLPGRKSVMLLSDGFSLFARDASGTVEYSRVLDRLRRLVDAANRASVVVYTMDARGLQIAGITSADNTGGRSLREVEQEVTARRDQLLDTQDGLRFLARETGGISIINSNDLSGGIRKILDDQSYYLLAYEPDEATFDPALRRFNRLDIKVTRPGARVRYRSGFFGISDENIAQPKQTPDQRLAYALTSPFGVNDISLRLNALFYNSGTSFIRSLVHIDTQQLKFSEEADGNRKATFDVIAVGFGDNGVPVDQSSKTFTITLSKKGFDRALKRGIVYDLSFPVKKPGAYQLRIALRDHGSDRLGSANQFIEVPNLKKNRLVLSGVVLENLEYAVWQKSGNTPISREDSDPLTDTSLRKFRRGTVLQYGFTIYNPKMAAGSQPNLTFQTRVFRDGKPVFEGKAQPVVPAGRAEPRSVNFTGALALGTVMTPGDYVLQVVITDNLAKSKRNTASQFVQFELIE